jgi:hypothetical protein
MVSTALKYTFYAADRDLYQRYWPFLLDSGTKDDVEKRGKYTVRK